MLPLTGHTFYSVPATAIYKEKTMPKTFEIESFRCHCCHTVDALHNWVIVSAIGSITAAWWPSPDAATALTSHRRCFGCFLDFPFTRRYSEWSATIYDYCGMLPCFWSLCIIVYVSCICTYLIRCLRVFNNYTSRHSTETHVHVCICLYDVITA